MTSPSVAARCSRPATSSSSHLTHLCKHSRMHAVGHGLNADRAKCRRPKTAAFGGNVAWSAYGWQCDMIGIPAVRHSDKEPVKRTNRPIFIYRLRPHMPGGLSILLVSFFIDTHDFISQTAAKVCQKLWPIIIIIIIIKPRLSRHMSVTKEDESQAT